MKTLCKEEWKNCIVSNSSMEIEIKDCIAESFNFGGVAGRVENASIHNNILDFYLLENEQVKPTISISSMLKKTIN